MSLFLGLIGWYTSGDTVAMVSCADDQTKAFDWSVMMSFFCVLIHFLDSDWVSTISVGYKKKRHIQFHLSWLSSWLKLK